MPGNFQPAKLDVDPSILDNKLSFVNQDEEDEMEAMFKQMSAATQPKIESLLPESEYPSLLVYPKPGLCIKTRNAGGKKFFINLCRLEEIPPPTPISEQELERVIADEDYSTLWRVPMSIGAPREDKDKSGGTCLAADVAVNSTWFKDTMEPSAVFTTFVITVAMEGLCDKHGEQARLERDGWTILKNKKYLGSSEIPPHRIQKRASTGISDVSNQKSKIKEIDSSKSTEEVKKTPHYKIEKNDAKNPTVLEATVFLPGITNLNQINLSIGEDRVLLETKKANFLLDIFLPFTLNPDLSRAAFHAEKNILNIHMPLEN